MIILEKDIVKDFCVNKVGYFSELIGLDFRVYGIELPIKTNDGVKYADVILEVVDDSGFREKKLYVLEFKKDKIDYHSVISQVQRYCHFIVKQLYKNTPARPVLVAPEFSRWELRNALKAGVFCVQLDTKGNMRRLC